MKKPKVLRTYSWDPNDLTTVQTETTRDSLGDRIIKVYDKDGEQLLGTIYEYSSTIDTKLAGSRLVHRGKYRLFWCADHQYWQKLGSMAAAIRQLLAEERAARRPGF